MTQKVSSKLLVLFGIICGTFFFAENCFCEAIQNKSSTFSTQMANNDEFASDDGDSSLAEQIRAQRAARDVRDTSLTVSSNTKSGAKKNSCDTDLRKCIEAKCSADYKKCETDSDTTFSDKLDACKKTTKCTAHEYALFVPEIKEDKKQKIRLSLYNQVINCGNSYNDCIIKECGKKFDKCLSKSAGDKALAKCKTIATKCTEADSGMSGRIGSVFATVRQDAEIQIKEDEKKLYTLRDQMRNSCKTLGALFDDRSLDCVFTASFYAGDDQQTPKASKKLYAGSLFDCTPDWFGIDITTFKENAYRLTRAQTAASSAMLGSGVGTAVGAITSGAIGRALDTAKAKDALEDACEDEGKVLKDGKCVEMTEEEKCKANGGKWKKGVCEGKTDADDDDDDDDDDDVVEGETSLTPEETCTQSGGVYEDNKCTCSGDKKPDGDICVDMKKKDKCEKAGGKLNVLGQCKCKDETKNYENDQCVTDPDKVAKKNCKNSGGKWKNNQCQCNDKTQNLIDGKCVDDRDKAAQSGLNDSIAALDERECKDSGGTWKKNKCQCDKSKNLVDAEEGLTCKCKSDEYELKDKKCVKKAKTPKADTKAEKQENTKTDKQNSTKKTETNKQTTNNTNKKAETDAHQKKQPSELPEITHTVEEATCNGITVKPTQAKTAEELQCVSSITATDLCYANGEKSHGWNVECDPKTKKCAHSCYNMMGDMMGGDTTYFVVCCSIDTTSGNVTCKKTNKTGKNKNMKGPAVSISDCQ